MTEHINEQFEFAVVCNVQLERSTERPHCCHEICFLCTFLSVFSLILCLSFCSSVCLICCCFVLGVNNLPRVIIPLPSKRQYPSYDVCLQVKREDYQKLLHAVNPRIWMFFSGMASCGIFLTELQNLAKFSAENCEP